MRWTNLAHMFANMATIFWTIFVQHGRKQRSTSNRQRRGNWTKKRYKTRCGKVTIGWPTC